MKILVADKFEPWGLDQLRGIADELVSEPGLKEDELKAKLTEFEPDILVVRSTEVPAEMFEANPKLDLVIRAGSGYDTIDIEAASQHGVMVSNCPGMNSVAVAELTFGLILALDRKIADNVADLRAGKWKKKTYSKGALGFKGRTIGILGAGRIGTEVARRALAFDMNVLYYHLGRQRRLVDFPNCHRADLEELCRESDVITVHIPGGPATRHLIDAARIDLMKPTALVVNTSRPGVIDEAALVEALRNNKLRGAAADVYENEPPAEGETIDTPLAKLPNFYGTHHVGASTEEAQLAVAAEAVRIAREFKESGHAPNCVNIQAEPTAKCMLVVRLVNKPGGLAHVFNCIAEAGINAEEMDHMIYGGGKTAVAHIRVDRRPAQEILNKVEGDHDHVLSVEAVGVE